MQLRNPQNRRVDPDTRCVASRALALPMLTLVLVSSGCAPAPPTATGEIPQLPGDSAGVTKPASSEEPGADAAAGSGLQPLPTPQQVIGAVPLGRRDPFAQLLPSFSPGSTGPNGKPVTLQSEQAAIASQSGTSTSRATKSGATRLGSPGVAAAPDGARPLQLPKDFSISGVIRSGGITEAVVSYGSLSGSLRAGDRGGRTTDLLPPGWSVAAVDVNQGLLTLQKDGRRIQARL